MAYMLGNPNPEVPSFGLIGNGGSFLFVKWVRGDRDRCATSDLFGIRNRTNNLRDVLKILKKLVNIDLRSLPLGHENHRFLL